MKTVTQLLGEARFFDGLRVETIELVSGCASNVQFDPGTTIFREGERADAFYLLRQGSVALETYVPARGSVMIETIEAGDVLCNLLTCRPHELRGVQILALRAPHRTAGHVAACTFVGLTLPMLTRSRLQSERMQRL